MEHEEKTQRGIRVRVHNGPRRQSMPSPPNRRSFTTPFAETIPGLFNISPTYNWLDTTTIPNINYISTIPNINYISTIPNINYISTIPNINYISTIPADFAYTATAFPSMNFTSITNNISFDDSYLNNRIAELFSGGSSLRRTDRKLDLTKEKYVRNEDEDESCSICQEVYKKDDEVTKLSCKHVFHHGCIEEWGKYKAQCPLCRKEIP